MKVSVSRLWHNPTIHTSITKDGINLVMDLEDFKKAFITEMGSVALVFTKDQFEDKVNKAFVAVVQGIKDESAKHV